MVDLSQKKTRDVIFKMKKPNNNDKKKSQKLNMNLKQENQS